MRKLKYKYLNTNPHNHETGDCAIRAIAKHMGISWEDAAKGVFETSLTIKTEQTSRQAIVLFLKRTHEVVPVSSVPLHKYAIRAKAGLLLMTCVGVYGAHMIAFENGYYFDETPCGRGWQVIEAYIPKEDAP